MRVAALACLTALALGACQKSPKPAAAASGGAPAAGTAQAVSPSGFPARRAGLWEEAMSRDGAAGPMGGTIKLCIDAATDAQMTAMGREAGRGHCERKSAGRGLDGAYHFQVACQVGPGGTMTSNGTASGDFSSKYQVHIDSEVTGARYGPINGHHVIDIQATYKGPCPADMSPGDMVIGNGVKLNIGRPAGAAEPKA